MSQAGIIPNVQSVFTAPFTRALGARGALPIAPAPARLPALTLALPLRAADADAVGMAHR